MRRVGPSAEVEAAGQAVEWPGKGDESPYEPTTMRFRRYSARAWPSDCPRGTYYPTGDGAIDAAEDPALAVAALAGGGVRGKRAALPEPLEHIFSHVRHTMHCCALLLPAAEYVPSGHAVHEALATPDQ